MRMTEEEFRSISEKRGTVRTTNYHLVEDRIELVIPLQLSTAKQNLRLSTYRTLTAHDDRRTATIECQRVFAIGTSLLTIGGRITK